jgi:hypothetical protein
MFGDLVAQAQARARTAISLARRFTREGEADAEGERVPIGFNVGHGGLYGVADVPSDGLDVALGLDRPSRGPRLALRLAGTDCSLALAFPRKLLHHP